jgi:hypothetical protein
MAEKLGQRTLAVDRASQEVSADEWRPVLVSLIARYASGA